MKDTREVHMPREERYLLPPTLERARRRSLWKVLHLTQLWAASSGVLGGGETKSLGLNSIWYFPRACVYVCLLFGLAPANPCYFSQRRRYPAIGESPRIWGLGAVTGMLGYGCSFLSPICLEMQTIQVASSKKANVGKLRHECGEGELEEKAQRTSVLFWGRRWLQSCSFISTWPKSRLEWPHLHPTPTLPAYSPTLTPALQ